MARARNLKPGFFINEELASCDPLARLLFIGLWCCADKFGRLENRPKRLKAEILPYDDCDVEVLLGQLHEHGFIVCYESNGKRCIQVRNFDKHQHPHPNEMSFDLPSYEERSCDDIKKLPETSSTKRPLNESLLMNDESLLCTEIGKADSMPEPKSQGRAARASKTTNGDDPVVLTFPVSASCDPWFLRQSKLDEYAESFPAVDVLAESRCALQWVRDNPRNRKTASGMPRFLSGWLGRCQNRAKKCDAPVISTSERLAKKQEQQAAERAALEARRQENGAQWSETQKKVKEFGKAIGAMP